MKRLFTVDEANRTLPLVRRIVDDATRSSSRILSRQARCCRTTYSTMRRTRGSVRLASSTVNVRFMHVPSFAPPRCKSDV